MPLVALVLSHDPMASALIGAAAETSGLDVRLHARGERLRDVLLGVRPGIVLADCDVDDAREAFVGPAIMTGARVALFCAERDAAGTARARALADRYDLAFFALPSDLDALQAFLDLAAADLRDAS